VLRAGIVGRPHGLDGSFYVTGARPPLLALGSVLVAGELASTVVRRSGTDAHPIVRLAMCNDRDAAAALRGTELLAADVEPETLGPDEYRAEDLEGARVVDGERELGIVTALIGLPSCECLSVRRESGGELLVPLVRDAIRSIDLAGRLIDVNGAFLGEEDGA
jgi:16S rRNA processing protein RimM